MNLTALENQTKSGQKKLFTVKIVNEKAQKSR